MNSVTDPLALQDATTWFGTSPVLDTLLAACELHGDEVTPAQRLTRQYASMNAMRLWTLVQQTIEAFHEPVRAVSIEAPKGRWRWPADGLGVRTSTQFQVEIHAPRSCMALTLHLQGLPPLVPQLDACSEMSAGGRRIWVTDPPAVPMDCAVARAFLTALVFSVDADQVVLGADARREM